MRARVIWLAVLIRAASTVLPARAEDAKPPPVDAAAPNFADEQTDFGVAPQDALQDDLAAATPLTLPGGLVMTTREVGEISQLGGSSTILIDVWHTGPHLSIPGALALPGAGDGGTFTDAMQRRLGVALAAATEQHKDRRLIFFCTGAKCWEAYNAALRAIHLGYTEVVWYRGGIASWHEAGRPLAMLGAGGAPAGATVRRPAG